MNGVGNQARLGPLPVPPGWAVERRAIRISIAILLAASLVGVALAADTRIGIALLLGLAYVPVALANLQLALVLWFPLIFLEGLPAINLAAKAGGLLLVGIWVAAFGGMREHVVAVLRRNAAIWLALCALLLWYSLSIVWADDRGMVYADLWHWYAVALLMLIAATTVSSERVTRLLLMAFVAGAAFGVTEGILGGGLTTATTAAETASETRLRGGLDDPNFLAAGIVPAIVLALALRSTTRGFTARWLLLGAVLLLSLGLVASESRGGIVAAIVAAIAALVVFKNRRAWVFASLTIVVGVASAWFAVSPTAWERVTSFDNGGSGRASLWEVAWRIAEDKPAQGVGLNNYPVVAADYVSEPGTLERTELVVDKAQVVHNAYLQAFAETGAIGLGLLLAVTLGSLHAAWRAAQSFARRGDPGMEMLARGVVVATIGLIAASFFISNGVDKRLWVLFALGPALLTMANRRGAPETKPPVSAASGAAPPARRARP